MKSSILCLLLLAVPFLSGSTDAPFQASVLPESRFSIRGTSTVTRFECETRVVAGHGSFNDGQPEARITVGVKEFDCGNRRMNGDMYRAMMADDHPEIQFEVTGARHTGMGRSEIHFLRVDGVLTIAGRRRVVELQASAERVGRDVYRVSGEEEILMSDFGIEPPTALAGLIRVHDRIVVHFDLLASTNPEFGGGHPQTAASTRSMPQASLPSGLYK